MPWKRGYWKGEKIAEERRGYERGEEVGLIV